MRGDSHSRGEGGGAGSAEQPSSRASSAISAKDESSSIPRLRLRFSVRGLMFLAATIAVGCSLWVHTPSVYGRIAACSILAFWAGYACVLTGDELFLRGGSRGPLLSKLLVGVGAPTLLLSVLTGTTTALMALANRFIVSPHSSWSLTPGGD